MEQSKLTAEQISEMSEVVAKYMGCKYYYDLHGKICIKFGLEHYCRLDMDWNVIHEVWEKVQSKCDYYQRIGIKESLNYGTKEQAFTALFNAIKFIQDGTI